MKILFFSPHAAIWQHAFPESLIAEALMQGGDDVTYVTCGGAFSDICAPMIASGLSTGSDPAQKAQVCAICKKRKALLRQSFAFSSYDLDEKISAAELAEIDALVADVTLDSFLQLEIDGIAVGRYATYELLLNYKKNNLAFSDREWAAYKGYLRSALRAFFASRNILEAERPERVFAYNSYYSVNHMFCALAETMGIPHYFLHAGGNMAHRLETMSITRGYRGALYLSKSAHWQNYKGLPSTRTEAETVTDHLLELFNGRNVFAYSAPKQGWDPALLREFFNVGPEQKVLLATMSSRDERFALEVIGVLEQSYPAIYSSQLEWVTALIEFAKGRPDIFLIIRVHPREFPNKRESVTSANAQLLLEAFISLPPNVKVNWPGDGISIYDLAEIVDVGLNAWSNAGKELSLLGIPTVLYSSELVLAYPAELNYVGTTPNAYFGQIDAAIKDGWSVENMRLAYRWCAFEYVHSVINLAESFRYQEFFSKSLPGRIITKLRRVLDPLWRERVNCRQRALRLEAQVLISETARQAKELHLEIAAPTSQGRPSVAEETDILRAQAARVLCKIRAASPDPRSLQAKLRAFVEGA